MDSTNVYLLIVLPVLGALAAVGALIFIKTTRRRQGTRDPRHTEAVPVNPMSARHARMLRRRYLTAAGLIGGLLILGGIAIA